MLLALQLNSLLSEAVASAPVWSTIPNQTSLLGSGTHTLDLDDYCEGATSYAVSSPVSLPAGWSLVGSILTWDTDAAIVQSITVTATNDEGSEDGGAFIVTVVAFVLLTPDRVYRVPRSTSTEAA